MNDETYTNKGSLTDICACCGMFEIQHYWLTRGEMRELDRRDVAYGPCDAALGTTDSFRPGRTFSWLAISENFEWGDILDAPENPCDDDFLKEISS